MLVTFNSRTTSSKLNQNNERGDDTMTSEAESANEKMTPKSAKLSDDASVTTEKQDKNTKLQALQHQNSFQVSLPRKNNTLNRNGGGGSSDSSEPTTHQIHF